MTKTKTKQEKAYIICTEKRGVFFGYATRPPKPGPVTLARARMCVYWSSDVRGLPGLAATGPTAGCRVTPQIPVLRDTATSVMDVSDVAIAAWESAPWG